MDPVQQTLGVYERIAPEYARAWFGEAPWRRRWSASLKLLACGGAARPQEMLSELGIDITDRAFWQLGFDLVRERIDELEGL